MTSRRSFERSASPHCSFCNSRLTAGSLLVPGAADVVVWAPGLRPACWLCKLLYDRLRSFCVNGDLGLASPRREFWNGKKSYPSLTQTRALRRLRNFSRRPSCSSIVENDTCARYLNWVGPSLPNPVLMISAGLIPSPVILL